MESHDLKFVQMAGKNKDKVITENNKEIVESHDREFVRMTRKNKDKVKF